MIMDFVIGFWKVMGSLVTLFIVLIMVANVIGGLYIRFLDWVGARHDAKAAKAVRHTSMYSNPELVHWLRLKGAESDPVRRNMPLEKYIQWKKSNITRGHMAVKGAPQ